MTTTLIMTGTEVSGDDDPPGSPDEAQLAAAAFLARYSGRTLEAYRHDLAGAVDRGEQPRRTRRPSLRRSSGAQNTMWRHSSPAERRPSRIWFTIAIQDLVDVA